MDMIDDVFPRFVASLEIADKKPLLVKGRAEEVVKCLKKAGMMVVRYAIVGSYARSTQVGSLAHNGVDVLVELPLNDYKKWQNTEGTHRVLDVMENHMARIFKGVNRRQARHGVSFTFPEFRLEVIPGLSWHSGGFLIPDMDQEVWVHSDPQQFAAQLASLNQRNAGKIIPLIKIVKAWNHNADRILNGFHLECLVYGNYEGTGRLGSRIASYPEAMVDFFVTLPRMINAPCTDPVRNQRVDLYLGSDRWSPQRDRAIEKAERAAKLCRLALEALDNHDRAEAFGTYSRLFGLRFPLPA